MPWLVLQRMGDGMIDVLSHLGLTQGCPGGRLGRAQLLKGDMSHHNPCQMVEALFVGQENICY